MVAAALMSQPSIERRDGGGSRLRFKGEDVVNLAEIHFQGPAELVPRFSTGDRVQIVTSAESSLHITSIKPAPLS